MITQILSQSRRDEAQLTRLGVIESRRITASIKDRVLRAYLKGYQPTAEQFIDEKMFRILVDVMVAMHLRGEKLEESLLKKGIMAQMSDEAHLTKILDRLASPKQIRALQDKYKTSAFKILDDTSRKIEGTLRKTVNQLILDGVPIQKGVKLLGAKFDDLGLTPRNGYQLETIFRTQSQIAYGAGRWEADQDPIVQSILWGYQYSTVGDDRVRPSHAALDGTKLPKEDPFWHKFWPPNGYNCRCTVIPIFTQERIKRPPKFIPGTDEPIAPDEGFAFNAGIALR